MSNLLEFGGKANVILRALCDFEVNGNTYKTDDVVFCFEEVDVHFTYNETVKDKTILLCDDVSTTGETLNECAKMLWLYGAKEIYCVAIALTLKYK
jgi:hypoxanthine-guanine phosphoribosyltransferase